ncbi:MAG TPA: methyl-accepting chemotaxis protein [Jatrophihabitans sp.]|nr:methyl-accepting chemotaxis protein [Jatrophihabitans sp.]
MNGAQPSPTPSSSPAPAPAGRPRAAGWRSLWLRDAPIGVKLAAIVVVGVLAATAVAVLGLSGLSSTQRSTDDVARLATGLQYIAAVRDAEGDMRVGVYQVTDAPAGKVQDAMAQVTDADHAMDAATANLRSAIDALHDPVAAGQLATFTDKLSAWRSVRDQQVFAAAAKTEYSQAQQLIAGPLAEADDAFAAPLDALSTHLEAAVAPAMQAAAATNSTSRAEMLLGLAVGAVLAVLLSLSVSRLMIRSLRAVSLVLRRLATGDLTASSGVSQRDQIGRMANDLAKAQRELRSVLAVVASSAEAVASSSEELSASSAQIAIAADQTRGQSESVAQAAGTVDHNLNSVAAGAEQMGASIREIATNAHQASDVAARAVAAAGSTNAAVAKLGESSAEIGNVVKAITAIAEQTNLLALNATIEAARAGEAGKGFAVVASEVKDLAQDTARSTEDIARRVQAIQQDTDAAVAAISEISQIIEAISDRQTAIASAVEEQTATTNEMTRSMHEAAGNSSEIVANVSMVSEAAQATSAAIDTTRGVVDELNRMSAHLRDTVATFQY